MNLLYMRYAVEIAKAGSICKAAEKLLVAQPNLSRSVRELENELGITIFDRSYRGISLTPDGHVFIDYAEKILEQIDDLKNMYKKALPIKQSFSVSVPRASYIADAFARFSSTLSAESAELFYMETNSNLAIQNILNSGYKLGIIRYAEDFDKYFKTMLDEKELAYETVAEFQYMLTMHRDSPLSSLNEIKREDIENLIEIAYADPFVPSLPVAAIRREELLDNAKRKIFVFDRASQFDLLSKNHETFMLVSPLTTKIIERYDLVQKHCSFNSKTYKDVLIYKRGYKLSELDKRFIEELENSKREYFK